METKYKYSVKQVWKKLNQATNKIAYKFEFLRNGHPIKIADVPVPKMDKFNRPILDKDMRLQYEHKPVYRSLELEFDPGVPRSSVISVLKRQLLELQLQDEARQIDGPAKVDLSPDISEITSDDLSGMDLERLKKKGK